MNEYRYHYRIMPVYFPYLFVKICTKKLLRRLLHACTYSFVDTNNVLDAFLVRYAFNESLGVSSPFLFIWILNVLCFTFIYLHMI